MTGHLVTLKDWSAEQIRQVVNTGIAVKRDPARFAAALAGKSAGLLFQKTSTRTRCSSEVGMFQLGGQGVYLDWRATNFGLADLADEVRVLETYFDFLLLRLLEHNDVVTAAQAVGIPVMNGCCNRYHPLQGLCDLQTVQERFGRLEGVRLTYTGVHNNVTNSLIAAGVKVGMQINVCAPEMNDAARDDELLTEARATGLYREYDNLREAVLVSDVVYTDTWLDMEFFNDERFAAEKQRRIETFTPYQLNREVLEGSDALVMHCLPAHRGYEIESELVDDPRSIVIEQAENRLHSQKAVFLELGGVSG